MKNRNFKQSFQNAFNGIIYTVRNERNMKVHSIIAAIVILLGLAFKLNLIEWSCIIISIGLVLVSELLNTAVEIIVDILFEGYDEKAKIMKDIAAGAVFLASIVAFGIGILIFGMKIFNILRRNL